MVLPAVYPEGASHSHKPVLPLQAPATPLHMPSVGCSTQAEGRRSLSLYVAVVPEASWGFTRR